jgi:hypothetical protein
MGILLPAFCTNNTVEMLQVGNIHDPDNMSMVNALLQENHNMKRLYLWNDDHHPGVPFVGSIRAGLVASRGNLQDLTFINGVNGDDGLNGNTGLQDVLSIYTTSNDDVDDCHSTYDVNNTVLTVCRRGSPPTTVGSHAALDHTECFKCAAWAGWCTGTISSTDR